MPRFTKGDPRINRKGRPKKGEDFKQLILKVLAENATDKDGNKVEINGEVQTRLDMIVRAWCVSEKRQVDLIAYAFGKPREEAIDVRKEMIAAMTGYAEAMKVGEKKEDEQA